eukprot:3425918-Amphidinium_carterae.2
MQELRQPAPTPQSSASPSWTTTDFNAIRQLDVRVFAQYIPRVIEFLEAWEKVPENDQPKWYKAALAGYNIVDRLKWIFEQDKPQDWIQPMPEPGMQSPQTTSDAAPAGSAPAAWQSYTANSSQPSAYSASSSWQTPAQSNWQLNSGTQNWNSQSRASTWQSSSYKESNAQHDHWWNARQSNSSAQNQHASGVENHPNPGQYNLNAMINDGNFTKVNFTAGKLRRLLPRARTHGECPDPEFEVKFNDEAMTHMVSFNSGALPVWSHEVMYSQWLPPSLQLEKMTGMRNPMHYTGWNNRAERRRSFQDWCRSSLLGHPFAWCASRNCATSLCQLLHQFASKSRRVEDEESEAISREEDALCQHTQSDMKRPFDHPRDLPTHGRFETLDRKHGEPHNYDVPSQVHVDWCRWAHEKTVNARYSPDDSHTWLLERELELKDVVKGMPPLTLRRQFSSPAGLFPQNWPDPDAPDEMNVDSHLLAALVMDDYDNRIPSDQVQVQAAVTYAHERVETQNVQDNERYVLHRPSDIVEVSNILLRAPASEADVRAAANLGVDVTTMHVSVDPTAHPPVSEMSAPASSGTAHKLEVPTPAEPVAQLLLLPPQHH